MREVEEETGLDARLGRELPARLQVSGRPKLVALLADGGRPRGPVDPNARPTSCAGWRRTRRASRHDRDATCSARAGYWRRRSRPGPPPPDQLRSRHQRPRADRRKRSPVPARPRCRIAGPLLAGPEVAARHRRGRSLRASAEDAVRRRCARTAGFGPGLRAPVRPGRRSRGPGPDLRRRRLGASRRRLAGDTSSSPAPHNHVLPGVPGSRRASPAQRRGARVATSSSRSICAAPSGGVARSGRWRQPRGRPSSARAEAGPAAPTRYCQRHGRVDQRAEDRERAVAVVHQLDQAALLRPVGATADGVDLPPVAARRAAARRSRTRAPCSRACGRPRRRSRSGGC